MSKVDAKTENTYAPLEKVIDLQPATAGVGIRLEAIATGARSVRQRKAGGASPRFKATINN